MLRGAFEALPLPPEQGRNNKLKKVRVGVDVGSGLAGQDAHMEDSRPARSTHPHLLRAPSSAHLALPTSGQSNALHVSLCRCVSCALCENLRASN
jgi:hypothetical protein